MTEDGTVELEITNGEITKVEENGKSIPQEEFDKYSYLTEKYDGRGFDFHFSNPFDNDSLGMTYGYKFKFNDDENNILPDLSQIRINGFSKNIDSLFKGLMLNDSSNFGFLRFSEDDDFPNNIDFDFTDIEESIRRMFDDADLHFDMGDMDDIQEEKLDLDQDKKLENLIGTQMMKDGYLVDGQTNKVELTGKYLKINNKKMPESVWKKYKSLFEIETGLTLQSNSRLFFDIESTEKSKKYKRF